MSDRPRDAAPPSQLSVCPVCLRRARLVGNEHSEQRPLGAAEYYEGFRGTYECEEHGLFFCIQERGYRFARPHGLWSAAAAEAAEAVR